MSTDWQFFDALFLLYKVGAKTTASTSQSNWGLELSFISAGLSTTCI